VLVWKADFPSAIALELGTAASSATVTDATLAINNRGFPTSGVLNTYKLSRGGTANDVSGPLP
jgi:hypothetical protein